MRHVTIHAGIEREVVAAVDVALFEGFVEAEMVFVREPDEVGNMVVRGNTVEVVALEGFAVLIDVLRSAPCEQNSRVHLYALMATKDIEHSIVTLFSATVIALGVRRVGG